MASAAPRIEATLQLTNGERRYESDGLATTVLPVASAGAIFRVNRYGGRFQGEISPATPPGHFQVC